MTAESPDRATRRVLEIAQTWDGVEIAAAERVSVTLTGDGDHLRLSIDAPYHADPPPPGAPGPTDGLWEYEVVELFVAETTDNERVRYTEIELSPHGHHLVLQLEGVRRIVRRGLPLDYRARINGRGWRGEVRLPRRLLPPPPHRVNAYAINGTGASRRYLAWRTVLGDGPDFHRLDRFPVLTLP